MARPPLPHEFDDELRARLAALDEASDAHAADQRPKNTIRSYAGDWRVWLRFTAALGVPPTAATRGTLRAFVKWLWDSEGSAPTTIDRRLSGVAVTLRREYGFVVDPVATEAARMLLKDYKRQAAERHEKPRGRGQAPALRLRALRQIVAACPDDLRGLRDRAAVLIAFAVAGRRHEVAALLVRHLQEVNEGLRVDVTVSKTHPRVVPVPYGQNPDTCPVRAWKTWRDAACLGEQPETAAFRQIHRSGSLLAGLSPAGIGDLITAAGNRAGVPIRFTGHSVRSGMATEARRAGKDRKAIAAITGHKPNSPVLDGYIRLADEFDEQDNALFGIGL